MKPLPDLLFAWSDRSGSDRRRDAGRPTFAGKIGREKVFVVFNDLNGTVLARTFQLELIGTNRSYVVDICGIKFLQAAVPTSWTDITPLMK